MEEYKFLEFIKKHSWSVTMIVGAIVLSAVSLDRYLSAQKNKKNQDYVAARKITDRLTMGEPLSVQSLESLEAILVRHPELHPQYDTLLALSFLQQDNAKKALQHNASLLKHDVANLSPFFAQFAKTSLLITEEKYEEAFLESRELEKKLSTTHTFETLHAFNLVRLAFLAKKLKNTQEQSEFVQKLEALPNFAQISTLFVDGSFTLKQYLT